jgi:predicted phosphoadenosine phosphosulfate sulfurtransferase
MAGKIGLGINVLDAAKARIARVFNDFPRVYVSFSGGKDSTVLLHLVAEEARRQGRTFGLLFIDLEAQYNLTIDAVNDCINAHRDIIDLYWVSLPIALRNAVSNYEPKWTCWEPGREADWVRKPPKCAITDEKFFPFFRRGMEFEEFVPAFGAWYSQGDYCACLVGIRADESLNRYRTIAAEKSKWEGLQWTTWGGGTLFNAYPIYDWRTADIWTYTARSRLPYNRLYDRMQMAGVPLGQQRICQPYGDDQRRGLWLFHLIEPETWPRIVARVNGANSGALYVRESGNILGNIRISKPEGHTWESFAMLLLGSLPPKTAEHYRNKIAVFLKWFADRGYPNGIPDEADPKAEAARQVPSWRRVCKVLLKNDYWCKGLSFTPTKAGAYENYLKIMKNRRREWGLI